MSTDITFFPLENEDKKQFMADMSDAFQFYAETGCVSTDEQILPVEEIEQKLNQAQTIGYKAIQGGKIVGGAIVSINRKRQLGSLEFLYVKRGIQSKGIGKFMWFEIERLHPDVAVWETITPAFAKRNIHFYVNVCGFHVTEYFNSHHPNPRPHPNYNSPDDDFLFVKQMK